MDLHESAPVSPGQGAQTAVVLALLLGLPQALAQGQASLSDKAGWELLKLVGAGPHLQGPVPSAPSGWAGGTRQGQVQQRRLASARVGAAPLPAPKRGGGGGRGQTRPSAVRNSDSGLRSPPSVYLNQCKIQC